jgi:8-hydroxy-5-deazaflavin:NADPH oxidoreductase
MGRPLARLGASMRIAVIGTGRIGGTLGGRWRAAGHEVVYGSRTGSGEGPGGAPVMAVGEALAGLVKHAGGNRRVALRIVQ